MIGALLAAANTTLTNSSASFSLQGLANVLSPLVPSGFQKGLYPIYFWLIVALITAIINVILGQVKQFQDSKYKAARGVISLIIAWFAASTPFVSNVLLNMSQGLGIVVVGILSVLIIAALAGYQSPKLAIILFVLAVAVFLLYGGVGLGLFSNAHVGVAPKINLPPTVIAAIVILILIVLLLKFL